jgi:O-antigen/teichoic acid export membrane protein
MASVTFTSPSATNRSDGVATAQVTSPGSSRHLPVGQSVVRGALALLSTQPITWAASLLLATVVPRLLGSDLLGQYAIVITISGMAGTFAVLGISEYLVRRFAQHPETLRQDAGIALTIQTLSACIVVLGIAVAAPLLPTSVVGYPLLLAGLLPVLGAPAQTVLLSSFRGREQHRNYAWFNAISVVLSIICLVLVLLAGGNLVQASLVGGAAGIVTTIVTWKRSGLRPILPQFRVSSWWNFKRFILGGLPFLSWQVTLLAYGQIDRLLLGLYVPTSEVGWYAAAYQIIGIVVFVPTLVIAPLFPALSRSVHDASALRKTIAQTLRMLLIIMGLLCVGSIVVAPGVPSLFGWPEDFVHAVPLMTILALHLPIVAVDMVLGAVLMAIHQESRLVVVGLAAVVFNITANLVAIPFFQHTFGNGAIGASSVTVLTEVLMCVGAVVLIPKRLLDANVAWQAARLVAAGAVAVAAGLAVIVPAMAVLPVAVAIALAGACAVLVYLAIAAVLHAITANEVSSILTRLNRRTVN